MRTSPPQVASPNNTTTSGAVEQDISMATESTRRFLSLGEEGGNTSKNPRGIWKWRAVEVEADFLAPQHSEPSVRSHLQK